MIPNIVHFNYGLAEQIDDFLFVYYLAVFSCKTINNPDTIYFYYHYEPKGIWWEKTKLLVQLVQVDIPTHIGAKPLKKIAHQSDVLRLQILYKCGGIYLDMDTICVLPYTHLLKHSFVICEEITESGKKMGLCNAIMMSEPQCPFVKEWMELYEPIFQPDGWQEASTFLPFALARDYNITILPSTVWLRPSWENIDMIFKEENAIPPELMMLHYWNQHSISYLKEIDWEWIHDHPHTLYAKLAMNVITSKLLDMLVEL
jgi:mannosyltransferase OCH1-like enzyme